MMENRPGGPLVSLEASLLKENIWWVMKLLKEICPRGNNKVIILFPYIMIMFIIHARIVLTGNLIHV